MKRGTLAALLIVSAPALLLGCGEGSPPAVQPTNGRAAAASFAEEPPAKMPRFHSKRFHLSLPLPDGKSWRIDDHSAPLLVATHPPTSSKLVVALFFETELASRQTCEERARAEKLVPPGELRTVEDKLSPSPEMFDTRVWVALQPDAPSRHVVGHVFAFGGFLRKCFFFHFSSEVPSAENEAVLSDRLAVARLRIFGGLTVDAFADPPRERPGR